ncbi:relaxase/mobilization nuclease domain-containing protein [Butyricicoccus faecihominis]|uniref:relaxase/mobilization nuclease domain-containing protein n=1 Tax=Butyricicoccus faecihominis TaxID=1712515 RepID=UPI00247976D7|nr:relaxase/mobilization nuclease domain-containing protein [Butyricicoccus faecihominis]MCQ5130608.1 relaxase/mobilization nuclease domain-containing protein [Butyricicoccus faecihominis]
MPLFKCTACKSTPYKVVKYVLDKQKVGAISSQYLDDNRSYARQFTETVRAWGKLPTYESRKYYHAKLSFDPGDNPENGGKLTIALADKIARRLARRFWPGHEVVIVTHIDKTHIHVHFIVNAVSIETGKMLHISDKDYRFQKDYVNQFAKKCGLSALDWREATRKKREKERTDSTKDAQTVAEERIRARGGECWKDELRAIIDEAKQGATDRKAFEQTLAQNEVVLSRNTVQTISYIYKNHKAVRGNKLGDAYTPQAVDIALHENSRCVQAEQVPVRKPGLGDLIGAAESKKTAREASRLTRRQKIEQER